VCNIIRKILISVCHYFQKITNRDNKNRRKTNKRNYTTTKGIVDVRVTLYRIFIHAVLLPHFPAFSTSALCYSHLQFLYACMIHIHCVRKKETEMFSVISYKHLRRFWWKLQIFTESCKPFPPHLNNVSTISRPCETYNAHLALAIIELREKETPESISPQLCPPFSPDLNPVDNSLREYCKRRCK